VDVYRDTGPGGQHRNKTESAVRLTHLPTGVVVTAVEDRSQGRNRAVAWERLRARLDAMAREQAAASENGVRREVVDSGRSWTWCGWRDSVDGPNGSGGSMKRALAGRLDGLL